MSWRWPDSLKASSGKSLVQTKALPVSKLCRHSLSAPPMNETPIQSTDPTKKKPLDTVVKLAIGVLISGFALIWGGMYLSRPDRSIPPFSVGSQSGETVMTHVPGGTTDQQIETLLRRFRKLGRKKEGLASMKKIQPTTPGDPGGRYSRIMLYVFDDAGWTEPEVLKRFLAGEPAVVRDIEKAVRGYYRLQGQDEEGGVGPVPKPGEYDSTARKLFKGRVTDPLPAADEPEKDTSLSPL